MTTGVGEKEGDRPSRPVSGQRYRWGPRGRGRPTEVSSEPKILVERTGKDNMGSTRGRVGVSATSAFARGKERHPSGEWGSIFRVFGTTLATPEVPPDRVPTPEKDRLSSVRSTRFLGLKGLPTGSYLSRPFVVRPGVQRTRGTTGPVVLSRNTGHRLCLSRGHTWLTVSVL